MYGSESTNSEESFANILLKILDSADDQVDLEIPYFQVNNNQAKQGSITLDIGSILPKTFALLQNYPNPFNPSTTISYQIPESGHVKMVIYNLVGQEIVTLEDRNKQAGTYKVAWNGLDQAGSELVCGVYFCQLYYRDQLKIIKLVKVK